MRKLVMLSVLLALVVPGTSNAANDANQAITFWAAASNPAYQNTDLSVWLGYRQDVEDGLAAEGGIAFDWRMFAEADTPDQIQSAFAVGPYGILHFPELINVPNPFDVAWLGDTLIGEPFIGFSYLFDLDGKGTSINPFIGARVFDLLALTYEYQTFQGSSAADGGKIGISLQYKF